MDNEELTKKLSELIDTAIEKAKKDNGIGSYSRVTYNELGQPLVEGINIAINDAENLTIKSFNNLLKALTYQRDFMIISESDYYKELEVLRDNYLIKGSSDWWKYTAEIIEYEQSLTMSQQEEARLREDVMEQTAAAQEKYLEKINAARVKYANKLKEYGDDFFALREVTTNSDTGATQVQARLANYEAYTNRLKEYQQQIEKLKDRGLAPDDLLNEITAMDVEEGMEYVNLLNRTSDSDLKKYIADRDAYINLCNEMAQSTFSYEDDPAALESFTSAVEGIFDKAGLVLPDNFFELGQTGADNFGEGFMGGLKIIEDDISNNFTEGFKSSLESAAQFIANSYATLSRGIGEDLGSTVVNNINNSFTVGSEKESSAQQINSWFNIQELMRMRNIE